MKIPGMTRAMTQGMPIPFPTVPDLADALRNVVRTTDFQYSDDRTCDVRLCVDLDGWILRSGSVDYDPRFSEVCAASCVWESMGTEDYIALANELIDDARDQAYEQSLVDQCNADRGDS